MWVNWKSILMAGVAVALSGLVAVPAWAGNPADPAIQKTFSSPKKAVGALVAAVRKGDEARLAAIFGPESEELIHSGDRVADRNGRERFLKAYAEKFSLENRSKNLVVLHIGTLDYPFPIPLVRRNGAWVYDTGAGKEEILNRRIGRNELRTIEVLHAYTAAQREYACQAGANNEPSQFARQLISSPGKHDGLYWPAANGEKESPFGPLIAQAAAAGYDGRLGGGAEPFQGYFFKILTGQGPNANGGPFDYVVNGQMVLGFGMVAYPARYGSTGVKTFVVNQEGTIYEKDLGEKTGEEAVAMSLFDPDASWQKCQVPQE